MINRLADMGTAILVTTHYLEEAEQCNRLGFMVAGELVSEKTPSGIKSGQGGRTPAAAVGRSATTGGGFAEREDGSLADLSVRGPAACPHRRRSRSELLRLAFPPVL
jgi:ABC-type multidrug transport system ATPase subunit